MSVDPSNAFGAFQAVLPQPGVEPIQEEQVSRLDSDKSVGPAGERVVISADAVEAYEKMEGPRGVKPGDGYVGDHAQQEEQGEGASDGETSGQGAGGEHPGGEELTAEQEQQVQELQQQDREVRSHEQAHMAAGGSATGGASYSYQTGPDGKQYASGGEVPITIRGGRTPEQTIANAEQAIRAAMAPSAPSASDRAVASTAQGMIQEARKEMVEARREEAAEVSAGGEGKSAGEASKSEAGEPPEAEAQPASSTSSKRSRM